RWCGTASCARPLFATPRDCVLESGCTMVTGQCRPLPLRRPPLGHAMKIATFNINNVNKRLPNLLEWLRATKPDVVCLQELKSAQRDFPERAINRTGYEAAWVGQKSWNGVAILSRAGTPVVTRTTLPVDPTDTRSPDRNSPTSSRG